MVSINAIYVSLIALYCLWEVVGVSDISGKTFLLAFPQFNNSVRYIHFYISTLDFDKITVHFKTHWMTTEVTKQFIVTREIMKHLEFKEEESLQSGSYCLQSRRHFRVTVFIESGQGSQSSMGSLQAVPLEGWGRKYITTVLTFQHSVQIVSFLENIIDIATDFQTINFRHGNSTMKRKYWSTIRLNRYESFKFYNCEGNGDIVLHIMSVIIKGMFPLGVISGNCETRTRQTFCNSSTGNSDRHSTPDIFIEMLLSVDSFGKDFIVFGMTASDQQTSGYLLVLASDNSTRVFVSGLDKSVEKRISYHGQFLKLKATVTPMHIKSRKKVGVVYVQHMSCDGQNPFTGPGVSVMTLILPTNLYMDAYFWDTVAADLNLVHYVIYICLEEDYINGLQLDEIFLNEYPHNFSTIHNKRPTWQTGEVEIDAGSHEFYSVFGARFGVYLYGVGDSSSYMNTAGFISLGSSADCKFSVKVRPGDLEDNDCDGRIDEERLDQIDNDGDNEVDEDLLPQPPMSGGWSQWLPWWCASCTSQIQYRKRQCNRPVPTKGGVYCQGEESEMKIESCHETCKTVHGRWGDWGQWECTSRCNLSTEFRKRKCNNPVPKNKGWKCQGHAQQDRNTKWCTLNCKTSAVFQKNHSKATDVMDKTELALLYGASAGWGWWSEWSCQSDCTQKQMVRFRNCDSPAPELGSMDCLGPPLEFTTENKCKTLCPFSCPVGSWGINCTNDCSHCEADCNKITGVCESCSAGFKAPDRACSIGCGEYEYGVMCEGSCDEKCYGDDCTERVHGSCPVLRKMLSYIVLVIFVLPVFGIVIFIHVYIYRLQNPKTEKEILRTHSSVMREYMSILERKMSFY